MALNEANVGGQAVIEGVMMRSEKYLSVAVRKPDGSIALKRDTNVSWTKRIKLFKLPVIRGGVILIESLIHGFRALSWSADIAMEAEDENHTFEDTSSWKSRLSIFLTLVFGLAAGLFLFWWIPLVLTDWVGVESGFAFNAIDGLIRLAIFGLYIGLISLWKEIQRIFQYHGAEHKSIFALENDCPLTIDGAQKFTTLHPRCGTSFLLVVMVVSIIVFMFLGKPDTYAQRVERLLFVPIIAGISYEFIRFSGKKRNNPIAKIFIMPGLWLQKITTREPSAEQLEVGLIALRAAIGEIISEEIVTIYGKNGPLPKENVVVNSEDYDSGAAVGT
ncbi:DUF1385 domain-containing protein [candidate division KSB1 bacterium]